MRKIPKVETIGAEATATEYDELYRCGTLYNRHYTDTWYYPLYQTVFDAVERGGGEKIMEVGCGSGSFAHLVFDRSSIEYAGFDFSTEAIRAAQLRTGRKSFYVGDARQRTSYSRHYDTIVCMEVLEHIQDDLDAVKLWEPGCCCVCTVPNFWDPTHVRIFRDEEDVMSRYGGLIDISTIRRVSRPLLRGRSLREYLRAVRWSRDDPRKFFALLGYKTFENLAGWFVFSGRRRADTLD
jgi:2-polyprenyl-3-methyl-5-hydroxy-6-metoxy-1,4-benzoquinol methylase